MGRPPWTLSQVCARWRHIALSMPNLWSCIYIDLLGQETTGDCASMLDTWVQRSGSSLLSIHFAVEDLHFPLLTPNLLRCLIAESHRWKSILLDVEFQTLEILEQARCHLPCLESVQLRLIGEISRTRTWAAFHVAPQLRHLSMITISPSNLLLPWSQLTSYSGPYPRDCDVFALVPNLVECHIISIPPSIEPHPTSRLVRLRKLTLHSIYGHLILDLSDFPSLEEISFWGFQPEVLASLTSLIRRSKCILRKLTIRHAEFWADVDVTHLFRVVPALTELVVRLKGFHPTPKPILTALTITDHSSLVPNLQSLELGFEMHSPDGRYDYGPLVSMLESRWHAKGDNPPIAGLNFVRLATPRTADMDTLIRLEALTEAGMRIELSLF